VKRTISWCLLYSSISISCISLHELLESKTIIWDIHEILFTTSKLGIARAIGIPYFFSYVLRDWKSPNIQPIIYDILERIPGCPREPYALRPADARGYPLPAGMCAWLCGRMSGQEILKRASSVVEQLDCCGYFVSKREKILVQRTLAVLFTPDILIRNKYPLARGLQLMQECALAQDNKRPKNRLILLSNFDTASFELLKARYPTIFSYFKPEDSILSSCVGINKPHKDIFKHVLHVCNLQPSDCIFIDDSRANIQAAQACGITGLHIHNKNYRLLKKELMRLGAL
jgi:hypothetical protein